MTTSWRLPLRKIPDFFSNATTSRKRAFKVWVKKNNPNQTRWTVIVPESLVKSSVIRHQLKRKLNQVLRLHQHLWRGFDVVVYARGEAQKMTFTELSAQVTVLVNEVVGKIITN